MKWLETSLLVQATSQHGLVHRSQLTAAGYSRDTVALLVRNGVLERLSSQVLRLRGAPATSGQRRLAAVLDAGGGAALAHLSAAHVWGMARRSPRRDHVVKPRDERHRRTPHIGLVHTARRLLPSHVVHVDGLPVTTPARTIVDLALTEPFGRVARLLDNAWGRRLLSIGELTGVLDEVRCRGRRGVLLLDHLLAERIGHRAPESGLEVRFEQILRRHRLPAMDRQVDIGDGAGWFCRADFARLVDGVAGFVDGATFHRALLDRRHDDAQTARLRAMGLRVFRVSDAQILYDAPSVARAVRDAT